MVLDIMYGNSCELAHYYEEGRVWCMFMILMRCSLCVNGMLLLDTKRRCSNHIMATNNGIYVHPRLDANPIVACQVFDWGSVLSEAA